MFRGVAHEILHHGCKVVPPRAGLYANKKGTFPSFPNRIVSQREEK